MNNSEWLTFMEAKEIEAPEKVHEMEPKCRIVHENCILINAVLSSVLKELREMCVRLIDSSEFDEATELDKSLKLLRGVKQMTNEIDDSNWSLCHTLQAN